MNRPKRSKGYCIMFQFASKEAAFDFLEDFRIKKTPELMKSFARASKESQTKKAKPIEELYEQYGI